MRHAAAALAAVAALVVAVVAGTGWLYLLRELHFVSLGPAFTGALPLEQLAGGASQPLSRMLVAWVPTGLALGVALLAISRLPRVALAAFAGAGAALLLLAASAISDAVAQNDHVSAHISSAFSRGGVWLGAALLFAGVLIAPRRLARRRGEAAGASPS